MDKYIKAINEVEVYASYDNQYETLKKLKPKELIRFNREKRRNGINWMEVHVNEHQKGYIRKNKKDIFICECAKLSDDEALGFNYEIMNDQPLGFYDIFKPNFNAINEGLKKIELRRTEDREKGKMEYITFEYDPNIVIVTPFNFYKKERFYITHADVFDKQLLEVDDFNGRKGFLLPKTAHGFMKDEWMTYVTYILVISTCLATFLGALAAGWFVMGLIFFIPAIIISVIIVFIIKIILLILKGIFNFIRKRF